MSNANTTQPTNVKSSTTANTAGQSQTPIAEKLKDSLHNTVDKFADSAESAEKAIRSGATHSAETLTEKQQQIQASWEASSIRKYAIENPVATAGMVFLAGALFGKIIRR
ncbi:DUF883 domain-containing protein [Aliiglaciecola sp. LCG003]|uniref:DUF883 domain-containing protein n=1 Tax=Aliiglaciecola sp. LCG003 TaxID=3053655 RepID=UPI0025722ACC|nr:DUF883 domain-containing protein [Aliiglaciecola sp. LCG003]WJG09239.1 DUF883 domain-containing protein [Aliiglaciecola sp. LCG003]